jgi:hypothetical protein
VLISITGGDTGKIYYWTWNEEPEPPTQTQTQTQTHKLTRFVDDNFNDFLTFFHK